MMVKPKERTEKKINRKKIRIYSVTGKQGGKAIYFKIVGDKHPFICKEWCIVKLIGEYHLNENIEISADFSEYFSNHVLPYLTGKQSKKRVSGARGLGDIPGEKPQ